MTRLASAATAVLLLLAAAGCGSGHHSQAQAQQTSQSSTANPRSDATPSNPRQLTDLRDIGQLRSLFNTRSGEPRLILLVSPT
jgi:hypothetical protein